MLRLMSKVFKAHDGAFEEVLSILSEALDSPIAKVRNRFLSFKRLELIMAISLDPMERLLLNQ